MKATCVLALVVCVNVVVAGAEAPGAVRPMDAGALEAYDHGLAASPSFRALVAEFERSQVVVHVVTGDIRIFGARGTTRFAGIRGDWRYLRVTLDPRLPVAERTAVLAHELQHACEIVGAAVTSQQEVRDLYERIGHPVSGAANTFETVDAAAAGVRVWREVRSAPTVRHGRVETLPRARTPVVEQQ